MIKCMNVWFFSITVLEFFVVFSIRLSTLTIFIIYTWFYFIWPFLFSCYILFQVVCLLSILVERMATLFCCRLQLRKAEMKTSEHNKARQRNIQFQLESREPTFIFHSFYCGPYSVGLLGFKEKKNGFTMFFDGRESIW